jgi:hypothetical protein
MNRKNCEKGLNCIIVHNNKESVKWYNNAGACLICSKIYNSTIIKASNQDKAYITAILGTSNL